MPGTTWRLPYLGCLRVWSGWPAAALGLNSTCPRAGDGPVARPRWNKPLHAIRCRSGAQPSLLFSAVWDAFQFLIPLHAHRIELNASSVGLVIASFSSGSLTVRILMPWISRWATPSRYIGIAMVLVIFGFSVLPQASELQILMAISFVLGFGPGVAQPLLMSALHMAAPAGRAGEGSGLRMTLVSLVQIASPVLLGLVAALVGLTVTFYVFSLITGGVALLLWKARREQ